MSDIIEAAARAMMLADWNHEYGPTPEWEVYCRDYPDDAETYRILARAATPLIRNAALEKAAQAATGYFLFRAEDTEDVYHVCEAIAARIRAFKEQP